MSPPLQVSIGSRAAVLSAIGCGASLRMGFNFPCNDVLVEAIRVKTVVSGFLGSSGRPIINS